jgi:hypothetical protein
VALKTGTEVKDLVDIITAAGERGQVKVFYMSEAWRNAV